jgi:hypothetical protein
MSVGGQLDHGINTLADAANIATDCDLGNIHTVTLGGNRVLSNPTNLKAGTIYRWIIIQPPAATHTLTYGGVFLFPGGVAPTLTAAFDAVDILTGISDGTNVYASMQLDFK